MTLDKSSTAERDLLSLLQSIKDEAVAGVLEKAVDNTLLSSVEVTRRNKARNIVAALKKVVTPELSAADLGSAWLRALAAAVQEVRGSVSKTTTGSILSFMAVAIYDTGMMDEGPFRSWLEDGNMDIILWAINSGNYTNAKWSDRFVSDAVSSDGYPPFDIVFKRKPGNAVGLATVWTDTECQAVRAIILDSMKDGTGSWRMQGAAPSIPSSTRRSKLFRKRAGTLPSQRSRNTQVLSRASKTSWIETCRRGRSLISTSI